MRCIVEEDINVQFGRILRKLRETRGHTQEEFANLCGMSRAYYGKAELGKHSLTLEKCVAVAEATGLPLAELFRDII